MKRFAHYDQWSFVQSPERNTSTVVAGAKPRPSNVDSRLTPYAAAMPRCRTAGALLGLQTRSQQFTRWRPSSAPATGCCGYVLTGVYFMSLALLTGCGGPAEPKSKPPGSSIKPAAQRVAPGNHQSATAADRRKTRNDSSRKAAAPTLDDALALAKHSLHTLEKLKDYTGKFCKRERVGSELLSEECNAMKIRHQPFSVYLRVLEPAASAGQEAIYVEGRNEGNLIAHTAGFGSNVIGRVSLDPHGFIATRGNRYTIKDVGLQNLVLKLLELGERKELFRESKVTIKKVEFDDRPCTQVEISSPRAIGDFRLAIARIVLDAEWDVPVHFESHEWLAGGGQKPVLSETYSYYNLKFDVGLGDRDFDPDNSEYAFP